MDPPGNGPANQTIYQWIYLEPFGVFFASRSSGARPDFSREERLVVSCLSCGMEGQEKSRILVDRSIWLIELFHEYINLYSCSINFLERSSPGSRTGPQRPPFSPVPPSVTWTSMAFRTRQEMEYPCSWRIDHPCMEYMSTCLHASFFNYLNVSESSIHGVSHDFNKCHRNKRTRSMPLGALPGTAALGHGSLRWPQRVLVTCAFVGWSKKYQD